MEVDRCLPMTIQSQNLFEAFHRSSLSSWSVRSPSVLWFIQSKANSSGQLAIAMTSCVFRYLSFSLWVGRSVAYTPLSSIRIPHCISPPVVVYVSQYLYSPHLGCEHQFLLSTYRPWYSIASVTQVLCWDWLWLMLFACIMAWSDVMYWWIFRSLRVNSVRLLCVLSWQCVHSLWDRSKPKHEDEELATRRWEQ